MTKNADFGPNLAVFGPKILIFMGVSKSFGTNITENQGWAPRPAPPREKRAAPPRPAPPRENWQNLRGGAGQSLFESLEN